MLNYVIKRKLYTFSKNGVFEHILPLRSESYFNSLLNTKQTFYLGIDPTANSLQIGNLFPLIALIRVWRTGHNIIALIGGATGQIGDPTDRIVDRQSLSEDTLKRNINYITTDVERILKNFKNHFLKNENLGNVNILNNQEWYENENVLHFISKILKHFRFHDVKNKRSFESRLAQETTMNMSEFIYPFLQANDWLHLFRNYNCRIQIGGDDQQGNIQLGQILIEQTEKAKTYGLTVPLFTVNGEKVGKSSTKSYMKLWLNSEVQSPYSLYYSLMHISNGIITNNGLLKRLTLFEDPEISDIMRQFQFNPNKNFLQSILADQVLKLVHGEEILTVVKTFHKLFSTVIPESINQQLHQMNESEIVVNNIDSVPNISVDARNYSVTIHQLIERISICEKDKNKLLSTIKFNGQIVMDLSQPWNTLSDNKRICGVLQIGSGSKWVVHLK